MTQLAVPLMIGGMGLQAFSSFQQGGMAEQQAETSAALDIERAGLIESQGVTDAQRILSAGAEEEASFRKVASARRGTNILNIARSGVMLEGSPLQVMNNIALETEKEALGIRSESITRAQDIKYQSLLNARSVKIGAASTIAEGEFAKRKSLLTGAGTLLKGSSALFGGSKIKAA